MGSSAVISAVACSGVPGAFEETSSEASLTSSSGPYSASGSAPSGKTLSLLNTDMWIAEPPRYTPTPPTTSPDSTFHLCLPAASFSLSNTAVLPSARLATRVLFFFAVSRSKSA